MSSNYLNKTLLTNNNIIFSKKFNIFYIFIFFFKKFIFSFFIEKIFKKGCLKKLFKKKNIKYIVLKKKIFFFRYYNRISIFYNFENYLYFYYNFYIFRKNNWIIIFFRYFHSKIKSRGIKMQNILEFLKTYYIYYYIHNIKKKYKKILIL